ncbi:MAG: hypothetical protein JSW25_05835 [Thermoplasmata archaeon]|nr:MAG: hypothetical protein JSW25_05835 [Thermoplasmata archaeon]
MELNRKLITVILVILIIVVPVAAWIYVAYGPAQVDSISLDSVAPDFEKRDGVRILATTEGSGQDFNGKMDLEVRFESEKVYTGKIEFVDGLANYKLFFEDFSEGNGDYEFKIIYEGEADTFDLELDVVAEELGVVSTATYNLEGSGHQPWESLYSYHVVFKTGWHFFTHDIERDLFRSYELGTQFEGGSAPLKVKTFDEGCRVEVYFTNQGGAQSKIKEFVVGPNDMLDTTIEFTQNGSYLYKYVNVNTVDISIQAYENRPVDKIPEGGQIVVTQEKGAGQIDEQSRIITEIDQVKGFVRPQFGPGNYTMTIDYPNPQVRDGHQLSTLSFDERIELNDKPRAKATVTPSQISTLQRTVTFSAVDSFDDGPKEDLYVFWSFGANAEGEIGAAEGPWEDMKEVTFTYPFGEDPNVNTGKPFLILRDAYGALSEVFEINLSVA